MLKRVIRLVKRGQKERREKPSPPAVTQEKREKMVKNDIADNVSTWIKDFRAGQQAYRGLESALKALGGDSIETETSWLCRE
jgi:hypothetical protein